MPTILVIDDSEFICAIIRNVFADEDVEVLTSSTAKEGIERVLREMPDLVLLDVALPDMDGYSTCIALKSARKTIEIPVIFITGHDSADDVLRGFESGAVDYINKPFNTTELKARVNAHLKIKLMSDHMKLLNDNLSIALEENRRLAEVDPLTGLYNRRYGWDYMEKYQLTPNSMPSALMMGDVDNFKKINDRYGHHAGDTVLCTISKIIREIVGTSGITCRWGGEEILIMLHDCSPSKAVECGKVICRRVNENEFKSDDSEFHCSITLGVAVFDFDKPIASSINLADETLYLGKKSGKNCCMFIEQ